MQGLCLTRYQWGVRATDSVVILPMVRNVNINNQHVPSTQVAPLMAWRDDVLPSHHMVSNHASGCPQYMAVLSFHGFVILIYKHNYTGCVSRKSFSSSSLFSQAQL